MKSLIIKSTFVLAVTLLTSGNLVGQDAETGVLKGKQLIQTFLDAHKNEFTPLQKEMDRLSAVYYSKQSRQRLIARELAEMNSDSLAKVRTSIMEAREKLAALEELEKHFVAIGENSSLKAGLISAAEEKEEKVKLERSAAYKPINAKRNEVFSKYKEEADEFAEILKSFAKRSGEHELTQGTSLKYSSFDSSYVRSSTSFYDEHGQKLQMQISLVQNSKPVEKLGKFLGKYPITKKDSWGGYTFLVGTGEVKIGFRIKEWKQEQVEAAADDLIDFEKIEAMLTPAK